MAIRVNPKQEEARWRDRISEAEDTGDFPLPAVDTIVIRDDRTPSISLIAPEVVPGVDHIFVAVAEMPQEEKRVLLDLLMILEERSGVTGTLSRIQHLGGLEYELYGTGSEDAVLLSDRSPDDYYWLSRVLRFIAELGQHFPNEAASIPKIVAA